MPDGIPQGRMRQPRRPQEGVEARTAPDEDVRGMWMGAVEWLDGFGGDDPLTSSPLGLREDLVPEGDVGCGKAHMGPRPCAPWRAGKGPGRFLTALSFVTLLSWAKDDGELDRRLGQILRIRMLVIGELGFPPLDIDGARLLFQLVSAACERQSIVFMTNLELSG